RETRPVIHWLGQASKDAPRTPYVYGMEVDEQGRTELAATDGFLIIRTQLPAGNEWLANTTWDARPVKKTAGRTGTAGEPVAIEGVAPPDMNPCYPENKLGVDVVHEVFVNPQLLRTILEPLAGSPACVRLRFWGKEQPI